MREGGCLSPLTVWIGVRTESIRNVSSKRPVYRHSRKDHGSTASTEAGRSGGWYASPAPLAESRNQTREKERVKAANERGSMKNSCRSRAAARRNSCRRRCDGADAGGGSGPSTLGSPPARNWPRG